MVFKEKFLELESKLNALMEARSVAPQKKSSNDFKPDNCVMSDNSTLEAINWHYAGAKFNLFMACASEDFRKKESGVLTLQLRIERP